MCLAVPVQIVSLHEQEAVIELNGVQRRVNVSLVEDPKVGDYVLVHAGFAIQKWSPEDVEEYNSIIGQMNALADENE